MHGAHGRASALVRARAPTVPRARRHARTTGPGFFDPLNLSEDIDEDTFDQYRTAELKHGRVAQLAVLGYIVPEVYRWPGDIAPGISFASIPNGVAAIDAIPALGWAQIIFLIGARARASRCVLAAAPVVRKIRG